jgi:NAD(P)H-flavin reductase
VNGAGAPVNGAAAPVNGAAAPARSDAPARYRVAARRDETADTATLVLHPVGDAIAPVRAGQFTMLYAFGVGEVPISVSGAPGGRALVQTVRAVGAVTRALHGARPGTVLGVRGPFGTDWAVAGAAGRDLVLVAGGIGLAPLRPVLLQALANRDAYGRIVLLVGTRSPRDLLFAEELAAWRARGVHVEVTVDQSAPGWDGHVGLVTALLPAVRIDPANTVAFVCGPELMMRFAADALVARGVPASAIRVSLERNMQCGQALCGHCQLGPVLLCRDGPVVGYDRAAPLLTVEEL